MCVVDGRDWHVFSRFFCLFVVFFFFFGGGGGLLFFFFFFFFVVVVVVVFCVARVEGVYTYVHVLYLTLEKHVGCWCILYMLACKAR